MLCRQYLTNQYRHIIFDNIEEDTPVCHDLLIDWLPQLQSALFIMDEGAGYRKFLGADPQSALRLKDLCPVNIELTDLLVQTPDLHFFQSVFSGVLGQSPTVVDSAQINPVIPDENALLQRIKPESARFYPQMLDSAVAEVSRLVNEQGISPDQVAILAPYLSDRLRFGLTERLSRQNIPTRVLRPSRSLQEDSFTGCLINLARLAHPAWELDVVKADFIQMLAIAIDGLDLCRAGLLADVVYRRAGNMIKPGDFSIVKGEMKDRITYLAGERYEQLRQWINSTSRKLPSVGCLLQPGVWGASHPAGFRLPQPDGCRGNHRQPDGKRPEIQAGVQSTLEPQQIAKEFILAVESGLVSAQYLRTWQEPTESAVIIAPAFTFLLQNRPVQYQIWLDAGSDAWFERLEQPLTHPYVLNRQWQTNAVWDDCP